MADNYLENKFEELERRRTGKTVKRINPSIDSLMIRNRSTRGYDPQQKVSEKTLTEIVAVNTLIASSHNQQALRFRLVTKEDEVAAVKANIHMGASLPQLHLPLPGTEPPAYIVICGTAAETPSLLIDLGIAAQSMLLKAVSLGYNGLIIRAIDRNVIKKALDLPTEPICVLAIGKSAEKIFLKPVGKGEDITYYRKDGIHYVPKIKIEDLLIGR